MMAVGCAGAVPQDLVRDKNIPVGLMCKNTFFDIPSMDADDSMPDPGAATCPLPTEGWWSGAMRAVLPLGSPQGPSASPLAGSPLSPSPLPPGLGLSTPDWAEPGFSPAPVLGPTPDWFGTTPTPVRPGSLGGGPGGHFAAMLALATADEGSRALLSYDPVPITMPPPPTIAAPSIPPALAGRLHGLATEPAVPSRDLLATAPFSATKQPPIALASPAKLPPPVRPLPTQPPLPSKPCLGTQPPGAPPSSVPAMRRAGAPALAPAAAAMGYVDAAPGLGPMSWPPGSGPARVQIQMASELGLPAHAQQMAAVAAANHAAAACGGKVRRRRGGKESKDPDRTLDDAFDWLPTATYVDLGCLVRMPPGAQAAAAC
mmetsp:Transcript_27083/g.89967  ORF Transcript_27083/g.89967 Transcript_27083/m.89967 type:complete len:373 (+) Transcript_27083:119-1237(+)